MRGRDVPRSNYLWVLCPGSLSPRTFDVLGDWWHLIALCGHPAPCQSSKPDSGVSSLLVAWHADTSWHSCSICPKWYIPSLSQLQGIIVVGMGREKPALFFPLGWQVRCSPQGWSKFRPGSPFSQLYRQWLVLLQSCLTSLSKAGLGLLDLGARVVSVLHVHTSMQSHNIPVT